MRESGFAACHPGVLFLYFCGVLASTMFMPHPLLLLADLLAAGGYIIMFCGKQMLLRQIFPTALIVLVTTLGNGILSHNGEWVLFHIKNIPITGEALLYGAIMGVVISAVLLWFVCLGEILTVDKLLYLFGGALPSLTLTVCMMLRYLPMMKRRYEIIHQAQCAMGRKKGMRQAAKEFSILISWSLENAIDTADAMESRGYGGRKRSNFSVYRFQSKDAGHLLIVAALGMAALAVVFYAPAKAYYFPTLYFPKLTWEVGCLYVGYLALLLYPAAVEIKEGRKWKS